MVSLKICGPKLSICGMIISVWGVVMLGLMGIFFQVRAPALADDLPIDSGEWYNAEPRGTFPDAYYHGKYQQAALNCFVAAGIYIAVFGFSFFQHRVNVRANYITQ